MKWFISAVGIFLVGQYLPGIHVPDDILNQYLNEAELAEYKNSGVGIFSITVYAEKKKEPCCDPELKCC